ncbi:hypothetical protein COCOR_05104 [Corallococcus coralloides DSM 2259]|uniref:Tetratricopeptide repeat protein n=1 Tax=Corallococcus coralloides (strain ATCC 25202 / DSM 2259 / NBRC 100086 / M2) TaxID=1144275 RepID=H8MRC3_CORCM|nr:tetratricopeptide repeat protein [Corallococcus coralloides]AFE06193.1 hypothetical protein COCOR_05104 [Corallococcus coralloides DSM 2259]
MRLIFLTLPLLMITSSAWAADPGVLTSADELYAKRADPASVTALEALLKEQLKATPDDFELVWRSARILQWQADGATEPKRKMVLGRQTWDQGDKAAKLSPQRVEGYYYAACGIGAYSQAVGIMKALGDGLEGKFNERLETAIKLDATYERGGPWVVKGRYYYELPWPKRDLGKSATFYNKAIARFPESLRAHYYLAETLLKDGKAQAANDAIQKVLKGNTTYDASEAQRVQKWATKVNADIQEELK